MMTTMEMVENQQIISAWEGYVDWRRRPALIGKHGGMLAASFVLVVEVLENLAFLANASNLVLYLSHYMHFSPSQSANSVTNFMGTAFMLALLGGFLSDAFFTTYHIYILSAFLELLGLVVLTVQAWSASQKPAPRCDVGKACEAVHGAKAAVLFTGLYLVALGVGGIKGSLATHGAEQLDQDTSHGRKQRSTFFNYFVFCLASGGLVAVTLVVWIEDNKGWQWGFGISTFAIFLSIPVFLSGSKFYRNKVPSGSPLTTISKVLVAAAFFKSNGPRNSRNVSMTITLSPPIHRSREGDEEPQSSLKFPSESLRSLNRAVLNGCSVEEVEEVKVVIKILPIFICTIMLSSCLAQLSTFSVHQASTMDTSLGSLKVPPASLPVFPVLFIMILAPLYDHMVIPFARKLTKTEMGVSHLQRIGVGLFLSVIAMAVAALVEVKRKSVAATSGLFDSKKPLPITFFWIAFQYLFLGSADLFTLAGLLEFFFAEAPSSMRSLATALSWASLAVGYYLSSAIVSIVNSLTGALNHSPWLSGQNLNHYRLERFYWLMCILSLFNFIHYLFWTSRYKYRSTK
ncbi:PREDICTED: protein NRT1/ PTR FAMILY 4.6-like [Ipomoea nil]|uniref:protein NRT1/ PTR FAMILY 4.6-like n=1 Tax=Ipomoea nil TaxID=35883 RepID=UPI0009014FC2|nr:PREDICTED: protein NRT1/ PTR FAMILY 4.6-like [Ipomoea nil]